MIAGFHGVDLKPGKASESSIAREIGRWIGERSFSFVFPTQADADSWARGILGCGLAKAVETERFISWDRYIEICRTPPLADGKSKADIRLRLVWALTVMDQHQKKPFLNHILQPGVRPPRSRAEYLARLAPALHGINLKLPSDEEISKDCRALAKHYAAYLSDTGYFEGSFREFTIPEDRSFLIFFPELCPGFQDLEPTLKKSDRVYLSSLSSEGMESEPAGKLFRFATQWDELEAIFSTCRELLDLGLQPYDIALSCPTVTPEIREYLEFFSRRYDIPLAFRSGSSLSSSPFGRLLTSIASVAQEGFSARTLRSFGDIAPFSWINADSTSELLRFASKYSIPELSADAFFTRSVWRNTFSVCGKKNASAETYFLRLNRSIDSITRARDFKGLRVALYDFRTVFIDEKGLEGQAQKTLERCLVELDFLERFEDSGHTIPAGFSPFEILLLVLDSVIYVVPERMPSVSIYPYHIGASVSQALHFVLDASQESTKSLAGLLSQVPPDFEGIWNAKTPDESLVFKAFDTVSALYCHADESLSGATVPHPYFSSRHFSAIRRDPGDKSPELTEINAWAKSDPSLLSKTISRQTKESALIVFEDKKNIAATKLDLKNLFFLKSCNAEPFVKFSPSRLGDFSLCPFRWFYSCVPDALYDSNSAVFRAEGLLYHSLIPAILVELRDQSGQLAKAYSESFDKAFETVLPSSMRVILAECGPSLGIALKTAIPKIKSRMQRLLDHERIFEQEGWNIGSFEIEVTEAFEKAGIFLAGRADRICTRPSPSMDNESGVEYAIVDYKRNRIPPRKSILADEFGILMDLQLGAYARMLSSMGKSVALAYYFSVESCSSRVVFGPKGARSSWNDFMPERLALEKTIESVGISLREGSFLTIKPDARSCAVCTARPSCRAHYHSEPA